MKAEYKFPSPLLVQVSALTKMLETYMYCPKRNLDLGNSAPHGDATSRHVRRQTKSVALIDIDKL